MKIKNMKHKDNCPKGPYWASESDRDMGVVSFRNPEKKCNFTCGIEKKKFHFVANVVLEAEDEDAALIVLGAHLVNTRLGTGINSMPEVFSGKFDLHEHDTD